jgi:1-acyl-sn-glycerol-3-phosphate acyltransferase
MSMETPRQRTWEDLRTASPLPFFVGTIALVLFTWVWMDVNYVWHYLAPLQGPPARDELLATRPMTAYVLLYVSIGAVVAFLCQPHPYRALGLLPWAGIAFWIMLMVGLVLDYSPTFWRRIFAVLAGVLWYVPFATALRRLPHVPLAGGMNRVLDWPMAAVLGGLCLFFYAWSDYASKIAMLAARPATDTSITPLMYREMWSDVATRGWVLFSIATVALIVMIYVFRREMLEALAELVFLPLYRFKMLGPGIGQFPAYGPVLIVSNHTAYFDPMWIGKVIPRQLTPMIASTFYDKPGLKFLVKNIVNCIRVQELARRKEKPAELVEAVKRLDQGECVLIFPEGQLRKRDDELLKHFGQGVWHILKERPETPVVPIWIEGGWGSFVSYYGGTPPLSGKKRKKIDWNRKITVVLGEPMIVDPAILQTQQATRTYLMDVVLGLRRYLPRNGVLPGPKSQPVTLPPVQSSSA